MDQTSELHKGSIHFWARVELLEKREGKKHEKVGRTTIKDIRAAYTSGPE